MKRAQPDIVVTGPEGDYLIIVEVKLNDGDSGRQSAVSQLRYLMASTGCSVGLAVFGDHIFLLRDSLEKAHGESIYVAAEATLSDSLLPPADERWKGVKGLELESKVQRWLEKLKLTPNLESLPSDLKELLREPVISLLRMGEVRAAGPRWSKSLVET